MSERNVTVAAIQCALGETRAENIRRVERLVRDAAPRGAQVVLPPSFSRGHTFAGSRAATGSRRRARSRTTRP